MLQTERYEKAQLDGFVEAISAGRPLPPIESSVTLDEAYSLQNKLAARLSPEGIAGLKAGVTNPAVQEQLAIDHALMGRLYAFGALDPSEPLRVPAQAVVECEIGIVVDAQGLPLSVGPAIEIACASFSRPQDMTATNLVAANLGAHSFIRGEQLPWPQDFQDISVSLTRDGEVCNEAVMREAFGGTEAALAWMLTEARRRSIPLLDNALLMTGACGRPVPALPGNYVADYGFFGRISFTIV